MVAELTVTLLQERRTQWLENWPRPARFLETPESLVGRGEWRQAYGHLAVERAVRDLLIFERKELGANRGPTIDSYNTRFGAPLGSPYCATSAGVWWEDVGLDTPPRHKVPSTDEWYRWAVATDRWATLAQWQQDGALRTVGAMALYGSGATENPASHIGIVARLNPFATFEANTSPDGFYTREGLCFTDKAFDLMKPGRPLLGFIHPFPRT